MFITHRHLKIIDDEVEKETIKLFDFKNKEQELEHKEEYLNQKKYYRIDDKKLAELEKSFKQIKTKMQ